MHLLLQKTILSMIYYYEFKQSALLWAATHDFGEIELTKKPVCKTVLLNLYDISEKSNSYVI